MHFLLLVNLFMLKAQLDNQIHIYSNNYIYIYVCVCFDTHLHPPIYIFISTPIYLTNFL